MNQLHRTDLLDDALRRLDVADDPGDQRRAHADLAAILTTDPEAGSSLPPAVVALDAGRRGTATPRRLVLAGAAATVLAGALVVAPALTGGDQAFATWTAVPTGLTPGQQQDAATSCREQQAEAGDPYADRLARADVAVAESRGEWTTVVLAGSGGYSALCVTDTSAGLFDRGMIGSSGVPGGYVAPGPREVVATDLGTGSTGAGVLSLAAGYAGPQVVAVAYVSASHGRVEATVGAGRFALWFPGDELAEGPDGTDVEVTYDDGSTETVRIAL